jgi:hypothetical protein
MFPHLRSSHTSIFGPPNLPSTFRPNFSNDFQDTPSDATQCPGGDPGASPSMRLFGGALTPFQFLIRTFPRIHPSVIQIVLHTNGCHLERTIEQLAIMLLPPSGFQTESPSVDNSITSETKVPLDDPTKKRAIETCRKSSSVLKFSVESIIGT